MKLNVLLPAVVVLMAGFLTACTPDISAGSYNTGQVGQASRTESGTIIAARPVNVANSGIGLGTIGGALIGGVAGSAIGGGTRMNVLGALGGAAAGGALGNYAEGKMTSQTGMQYTIKLANRSVVTITQGMDPILNVGQHVYVIFGNPARVISR